MSPPTAAQAAAGAQAQAAKARAEAQGQLQREPALVHQLDRLRPTFHAALDIQPGSIHAQILEARLAAELSPEELAQVKQAWADAETLVRSAAPPVEIVGEAGKVIGTYQHGSRLVLISKRTLHGGNTIKLCPDATTTITGTLTETNAIAARGERLPGATLMGENPGGINILRSPQWRTIQAKHQQLLDTQGEVFYWKTVTDEFWETINKPWLDDAIARGDQLRLISNPADEKALFVTKGKNQETFVLDHRKKIQSIFGREVEYLKSKGYVFKSDGIAVKVK